MKPCEHDGCPRDGDRDCVFRGSGQSHRMRLCSYHAARLTSSWPMVVCAMLRPLYWSSDTQEGRG